MGICLLYLLQTNYMIVPDFSVNNYHYYKFTRHTVQGVSDSYLENESWSFTIGPGFYRADANKAEHPRVPRKKFCEWVVAMNESNQPWQLIVSFNEWGEGTAVESALEWKSKSGYGIYLDCLHDPVKYGGS